MAVLIACIPSARDAELSIRRRCLLLGGNDKACIRCDQLVATYEGFEPEHSVHRRGIPLSLTLLYLKLPL